jgi:hypothetical protein
MGQEARTTIRYQDTIEQGKAVLETDELVFRGEDGLRLKVPFKEMRSVEVRDGELRFESPGGLVALSLGEQAGKWAEKIMHPKSLLDKLGIKAGMNVLVLGAKDEGFLADLRERADGVALGKTSSSARPTSASGRAGTGGVVGGSARAYDVIFVAVNAPQDLTQLAELKRMIKPDGAVWVVFRKGRKDFTENDVLRGGLDSGLVDVKVVRSSDTHAASKFVIRKAERG